MTQCTHCGNELPNTSDKCPYCGADDPTAPDPLLGSEILGRYRLHELLAVGGMGRVYLAEQAVGSVNRRVAVKVLRRQLGSDRQLMQRFEREAETLVRLTHPNTVQLFDFGALPDGTLALAMEYVQGHSLARELLQKGSLTVARAERMLTQICGALQEAHAHGIVHRDLKPDNLLISDRVGQDDFVKVLDFGIAKISAEEELKSHKLTQQGMIIGTPPYMSPEQFSGERIDARSDIYSLGVIAFEMLCGRLPFSANTPWEWASKHLTQTPERVSLDAARGISEGHASAIERALAKKVEDRPPSVEAFLAAFTLRDGAVAPTLPMTRQPAPVSSNPPLAVTSRDSAERAPTSAPLRAERPAAVTRPRALMPLLVLAAVLALLVALGLGGLRDNPPEDSTQTPAPSPAALPSPAPPVDAPAQSAEALPPGEEAPPAAQPPSSSTSSSARRAVRSAVKETPERSPRAAKVGREPADPAPTPAAKSDAPAPARRKAETASPAELPDDLQQRIAQIRSAALERPELALGLYRAAAGRYGTHPSLSALRAPLGHAGETRVRSLLASGRCAQAQALQRALRGALGAQAPASPFGAGCPAP